MRRFQRPRICGGRNVVPRLQFRCKDSSPSRNATSKPGHGGRFGRECQNLRKTGSGISPDSRRFYASGESERSEQSKETSSISSAAREERSIRSRRAIRLPEQRGQNSLKNSAPSSFPHGYYVSPKSRGQNAVNSTEPDTDVVENTNKVGKPRPDNLILRNVKSRRFEGRSTGNDLGNRANAVISRSE